MRAKSVYIVLYRGVGGATQLPVATLREALASDGFEKVATYINSGNAVLRSALPRAKVIAQVASICEERFAFSKAIFAPTLQEWADLIEANLFPRAVAVPKFLHAALLAEPPNGTSIQAVQACAKPGEGFAVIGQVAYLHTPGGFGTSKLAEKFDKVIGVLNTARNWNTVLKLREMATRIASE